MGNATLLDSLLFPPLCAGWSNATEGAMYQLGGAMLFLGYMGGSGAHGCLYIFGFLVPAHGCLAAWGWLTACGLDVAAWNLLLLLACLAQVGHLLRRLHRERVRGGEELGALYRAVYLPLGVPAAAFRDIAGAFDDKVVELKAGETYAVEGKTPIDQLSFLLSGRINVSLEGQFLHYIHRHQFLDSPEWESVRPSEEGQFQVTLTAEEDSRYISWRRRRLYLAISKDRYIARVFSVMLGYDIAEKLYNLNNKLYLKSGVLLDIRLPSLYHVLAPSSQGSEGGSGSDGGGGIGKEHLQGEDPAPANQMSDLDQFQPYLQGPRNPRPDEPQGPQHERYQHPWVSDPDLPTGSGNDVDVPPRFQRGRAPLAPTDTPKL
ncbi:popeye domain-containing 2 isoform X2 [Pseudoliparis swirei]|uniref:popeye domain-containing 2 isoform X2 n=1 Tax=Pseudoliparis swirei TaxID=2059687 RepID=UPI0024BDDCCF|nr:popeye domain-containing 2 isoform X2 [Pseudoliparis swirei]